MKNKNAKFGLIFAIICNVAIILCFVICFLGLFFNINHPDKIDRMTFVNYMESKGCNVIDILDKENYFGMNDYLITDKKTCPYLVNYATFNDKNVLEKFFRVEKEMFYKIILMH